ncbi:MAG: N-acetyltransferase [Thaumarchaeota archaeon]|nr:N-acetyltransferase [Nitrososphaerota archaeon]
MPKAKKTPSNKPLNHIGRNVKIGKNVKIWNFTYIGDNTKIGNNVKIGSLAHIDYDVKIGDNTRIEGMAYLPPKTVIGRNVFIGPGAILTNDPYPPSRKLIGVVVEDGAVICAGALVKAGVRIGRNSIVAMGAVVVKNVPPNVVVMGVPATEKSRIEDYSEKRTKWESQFQE